MPFGKNMNAKRARRRYDLAPKESPNTLQAVAPKVEKKMKKKGNGFLDALKNRDSRFKTSKPSAQTTIRG